MARPITCPAEIVEQLLEKARGQIVNTKYNSTRIDVSLALEKDDRVAEIYFSVRAWVKMSELVKQFSTEVQWHGSIKRLSPTQFFVEDIIVFPHEVTGTSVESKQEEYEAWLDSLDDETFEKVRFHGHSHVDFNVHPSGKDEEVQGNFLKGLGKPVSGYDPFYVFLIINKRGDVYSRVYDITNNAFYEDDQVVTDIFLGEDKYLSGFIGDAKKLATPPVRPVGFGQHGNNKKKKKDADEKDKTDDYEDGIFGYSGYGGNWR